MSRIGRESKPPWQQVPQAVRQHVAVALGAPVRRATRIWGGYAPTPTYRLVLQDGRRAFFKGTSQDSNAFMKSALVAEERVYQELTPVLGQWMPRLYATFQHEAWHVLLLEDLGPGSVLPWTREKTRAITYALAAFHRASLGAHPPPWLPPPEEELAQETWRRTAQESLGFQRLAALAGPDAPHALRWFEHVSPTIEQVMQQPALQQEPYALLHGDLRSDNLHFRQGQLRLVDWPAITLGRPEWDMVAFAQTVTVEGGPAPEEIMGWYGEQFPLRTDALEGALAWWLTLFADRAWRLEVPGLPRLRRFQRQQLAVLICWATRHWSLPSPDWVQQVAE